MGLIADMKGVKENGRLKAVELGKDDGYRRFIRMYK